MSPPGKVFTKFVSSGHRSNVFEYPEAKAAARQKLPVVGKCHSIKRNEVFTRTSSKFLKRRDIESVKLMLSQPTILIEKAYSHATLMQLVADCRKRELHIRSWRQKYNPWIKILI